MTQQKINATLPAEPAPGKKTPEADENALRPLGSNEFFPRRWEFLDKKHTLRDLMRPGFFTGEARARLRAGDEITFTMAGGSKVPSEWQRGVCVVEEVPSHKELPLILAGYVRYPKATPWRLDVVDDEKAA